MQRLGLFNIYMSPANFFTLDPVKWECTAAVVLQWCESCTEAWIVRELREGKGRKDQRYEGKTYVFIYREDEVGDRNCI